MDLLRLLFAALVLLAHAPEIADGNEFRELLFRLTHAISFGSLAVDGFFILSGYLIVRSWVTSPSLLAYLRRRVLRIVPGYLVAVLVSTLVIGLVAPAVPHFFRSLDKSYLMSILFLGHPLTPPVFPGLPVQLLNDALWTIGYEFRCYLLVPLFAAFGLLRRPFAWLAMTICVLGLTVAASLRVLPEWRNHMLVVGNPQHVYRLTASFMVGGCFYLFRPHIRFTRGISIAAALAIVLSRWTPHLFETVLIVAGAYLIFHLTSLRSDLLARHYRFPDVSYGLYLYGWPVESLLLWYFPLHPWRVFVAALVCCLFLGWLSWEAIEKPALRLKVGRAVDGFRLRHTQSSAHT